MKLKSMKRKTLVLQFQFTHLIKTSLWLNFQPFMTHRFAATPRTNGQTDRIPELNTSIKSRSKKICIFNLVLIMCGSKLDPINFIPQLEINSALTQNQKNSLILLRADPSFFLQGLAQNFSVQQNSFKILKLKIKEY